ncbi:DUF1932 domain-containing protein [Oceanobacillus sp. M60]|uniref:DUF1932 domain-containing protein n=1 Tax=Oceanobacillus sp. FSL K6-0251 TaxID=2921602 RepID=UPI0030FC4078
MNIGFIGYGEVGREITKSISEYNVDTIYAFDPLFHGSESKDISEVTTLSFINTPKELVRKSIDILFVAVPANNAVEVWNSIIDSLDTSTLYVDLTTASAEEKKTIAEKLDKKGLNLIDAAIMGALKVYGHKVPMLVSGTNGNEFVNWGQKFDMNLTCISKKVGDATNFKFIRSIFTKGLSTLLYEVMETAEKLELEDEILDSITSTMDRDPFEEIVERYIKSNVPHSKRREKEMENVIEFMKRNGVEPYMTNGTKSKLEYITRAKLDEKLKSEEKLDWKKVIHALNS